MQSLPPEIIHIIFSHLRPEYVTKVRLVCQRFAHIGLSHLRRSYNLRFHPRSFKRLLEISQHPIVSQHVESLHYEANHIVTSISREGWEEHITAADSSLFPV